MGTDFSIGCNICKEFVDLHKWPIIEAAADFLVHSYYKPSASYYDVARRPENSPYPIKGMGSLLHFAILGAQELLQALDTTPSDHDYIRKLIPIVREFISQHANHELFLTCDLGEEPWNTEGWLAEWKEIPGAFNFHSYLPRNLIEDLRLRNWEDAESFLSQHHDWLWHGNLIENVRLGFDQLMKERGQVSSDGA